MKEICWSENGSKITLIISADLFTEESDVEILSISETSEISVMDEIIDSPDVEIITSPNDAELNSSELLEPVADDSVE